MIPISILVKLNEYITSRLNCELFIEGSLDFGIAIRVKSEKDGRTYLLRHEFSRIELDKIIDKDILFEHLADSILSEYKDKGFPVKEEN